LDKSIAAQSAKLSSLALIPEVKPSSKEGAYGCSGELVSESKRIHQTVRTYFFVSRIIWSLQNDSKIYRRTKILSLRIRCQG
jgi:hypothetical protein